MSPYSKDLRLRVLAAIDRGMPIKEVAEVFKVSVPTIKRGLKKRQYPGCRDEIRAWTSFEKRSFAPTVVTISTISRNIRRLKNS